MPEIFQKNEIEKVAKRLIDGAVAVLPTDTIYGLHCVVNNKKALNKIYRLKERPKTEKLISLIRSIKDVKEFDIELSDFALEQTEKYWPGPNTLILTDKKGETHALRLPQDKFLLKLLEITGPLISTSANKHKQPAILDIDEAVKIFKNNVDFYVDGGKLENKASNLYLINDAEVTKLR